MKQSTRCIRPNILAAILLFCLCLNGAAQQQKASAQQPDLALEVIGSNYPTWEIPALNGGRGVTSGFNRIKSWEPSSTESPVESLVFKIGREADIVIAHLSVRLTNEKELLVSTYRLHMGEEATTVELSKYGLESLRLKVVKAKPSFKVASSPIQPLLENKTKVIEIVDFYQESLPSERFRLTLRNISTKNIVALDLFMPSADGNGGGGQRVQGDKENPVMLPGNTSDHFIHVSGGGRMTPDGYVPNPEVQQTLIIRTVVFEDGPFDGLVEPAAEIEAQRRGLEMQRTRILRLLQEATIAESGNDLISLDDLKERAYALDNHVNASVALELQSLFPSLHEKTQDWFVQNVKLGLRHGKHELLARINEFEQMQKQVGVPISISEWIEQTKANYEKLTHTF